MTEPRWRTVLCWSAVVTFFSMPLVVFVLHIIAIERSWNAGQRWEEFTGIGAFYQIVAALVFGLAGLHSWDKTVQQRFNGGKDAGRGKLAPINETHQN